MDTFLQLIKKERERSSRELKTLAIAHKVLRETGLEELMPLVVYHTFYRRTGWTSKQEGHPDWAYTVYNDLPKVRITLYIEDEHRAKVREVFLANEHEARKSYSLSDNCNRPCHRQLLLVEEWRIKHTDGSEISIYLYRPTHVGEKIAGCTIKETWSKPYTSPASSSVNIVCNREK